MRSQYDYIVVGAGAAGCPLAREILMRGFGTVLLVEAGAPPVSPRLRVPSDYPYAFGSRWDWNHRTIPQPGLGGRRIALPAGKALGGSTSLNAMIYLEAPPNDFVEWQSIAGPEWSESEVRPAYAQVRHWLRTAGSLLDSDCRLPSLPPLHPITQAFAQHALAAGWSAETQGNGFDIPRMGIDAYRRMQFRGRRISAWRLFEAEWQQAKFPANATFDVLAQATVLCVTFDGQRANGVELVLSSGERETVSAAQGVILCAGAIETPRLLMASGIGPSEYLAEVGIECRFDAPRLGEKLQDHLVFPVVMAMRDPQERFAQSSEERRLEYVQHRTGGRSSNLAELGGFFGCGPTAFPVTPSGQSPEFQWHITPTHYLDRSPFSSTQPCISFAITPLRSTGRGRLIPKVDQTVVNPHTLLRFEIDPKYLEHSVDSVAFLSAIAWTRRTLMESPWSDCFEGELFPGAKRGDVDRIEACLRRFATTIYHYAGTCAMGIDQESCLDPKMQLRGVEGLWVCDASSMPTLVQCNPQATVMMLSMRLAAWLEEQR